MKTSQLAALLGVGIGALLIYLAFNSGERVIVGALEDGHPIFDHVLNKPMLGVGIAMVAASVVVFALGFRRSPAGAGRTDVPAEAPSPAPDSGGADQTPRETGTPDESETEPSGG